MKQSNRWHKLPHSYIISIKGISNGEKNHHPLLLLCLKPNSLKKDINKKILKELQKNLITV